MSNRSNYLSKQQNMGSVYILTIKSTNEKHYFTSVLALCKKFDYDILKIKYISLGKHSFKRGPYENKHITIEKVYALSPKEVDEEKEKDV